MITALRSPRAAPASAGTRTSRPATRVPPNYDSLVGKLIVHHPTRAEAIAAMRRALDELVDRGHPDHDPAPPPDLPQPRLHRGPRRHHLGRARPDARPRRRRRGRADSGTRAALNSAPSCGLRIVALAASGTGLVARLAITRHATCRRSLELGLRESRTHAAAPDRAAVRPSIGIDP